MAGGATTSSPFPTARSAARISLVGAPLRRQPRAPAARAPRTSRSSSSSSTTIRDPGAETTITRTASRADTSDSRFTRTTLGRLRQAMAAAGPACSAVPTTLNPPDRARSLRPLRDSGASSTTRTPFAAGGRMSGPPPSGAWAPRSGNMLLSRRPSGRQRSDGDGAIRASVRVQAGTLITSTAPLVRESAADRLPTG